MTSVNIGVSQAMGSPLLFEPFFHGHSWGMWRTIVKAAFAEPMTRGEIEQFKTVAERDPPAKRVRELVVAAGRGAGKDSIASLLAVCAAINFDPRGKLRPGERATVACIACDRSQAGIVHGYIKGYFDAIPALKALVTESRASAIELSNGVTIEVHANSFRAIRGRSLLCVVLDEIAFFRDETSATPDVEIVNAIGPGLARMKNSMLIMISSVHKRSGVLYKRIKKHFGHGNDDVLAVKGTTLQFNPSFDAGIIRDALEEDPERAAAEYNSEWRDDLTSFISRDLLDSLVDKHITVRPPEPNTSYIAGCDASGGRGDSFTMAIAHRAKEGSIVLDLLFERKAPFNPSEAVHEISQLLKQYRVSKITGDNYSAEWIVDAFAKQNIRYEKSELARSGVYMCALPLFTSGRARLLDNPKMISQFASLERRTFPTGRERIDPGPGHDDLANSAGLALSLAASKKQPWNISDATVEKFSRPMAAQGYGQMKAFI